VLDLMEEFRPLVDNLVIRLVNRREIRPEHFKYNLLPDEESEDDDIDQDTKLLPVCMSHEGMKILITAFAKMVNSKFRIADPPGLWTLKDIFLLQARKLSHQFEQQKPYTSFQWL
jgi:CRISPR/Cas system-associated endonuclease Cas1